MRATKKRKGQLVGTWTVVCSHPYCDRLKQFYGTDESDAKTRLITDGWGTGADGWLCPECLPKVETSDNELVPGITNLNVLQLRNMLSQTSYDISAAKVNEHPERIEGLMKRRRLVRAELDRRLFEEDKLFLIDNP